MDGSSSLGRSRGLGAHGPSDDVSLCMNSAILMLLMKMMRKEKEYFILLNEENQPARKILYIFSLRSACAATTSHTTKFLAY
eukprot:12493916-Ditylum_brightwellii.AAC.1